MKEFINSKDWSDCLLESITVDYDKALVKISYDDNIIDIICVNFISIQYLGQWDESVIKAIKVYEEDGFCQDCKEIVKKFNPITLSGGGVKKIDDIWYHIEIELLDGVKASLICTEFKVVE